MVVTYCANTPAAMSLKLGYVLFHLLQLAAAITSQMRTPTIKNCRNLHFLHTVPASPVLQNGRAF
jgi:hypothetical protein